VHFQATCNFQLPSAVSASASQHRSIAASAMRPSTSVLDHMLNNEIITRMNAIQFTNGMVHEDQMVDIIKEIKNDKNPRDYVSVLFNWFELNAGKDVGSPGPFVHFIEMDPDYHGLLLESIRSTPTEITLWMANRMCNSTNGKDKESWVSAIKSTLVNPTSLPGTILEAQSFLKYQGVV